MEKKSPSIVQGQLDFNAPLLSVRRLASSSTENDKADGRSGSRSMSIHPVYRSEFNSGPLRNPGTVPFVWEQSPGRPKDEEHVKANHAMPALRAPSLPPGRTLAAKQANTETQDLSSNGNANTHDQGSRTTCNHFHLSNRQMNKASLKVSKTPVDALASNVKDKSAGSYLSRSRPAMPFSQNRTPENDSDFEDCDAFSDAVETLSQTESGTVGCSVSIVSGMEDQDLKPPGGSVDLQTRNFMIDRFLPAAKAIANESPQHTSRRPPVKDLTMPVDNVRDNRRPLPFQSSPSLMKREIRKEEYDDISNFSLKACGFFPWRLRNAFSHLNLVSHSQRMSKKKPLSLMSAVNKGNSRSKISDEESFSDTDDEEKTWEAIYRQKLVNGSQPNGYLRKGSIVRGLSLNASPEVGDALMNRMSYGSDSQTFDRIRASKRGSPGGISPYRNESPLSPFHEGTGFLGFPKACKEDNLIYLEANRKSFNSLHGMGTEDLSMLQSPCLLGDSLKSGSVSPVVEKTVYVDSVHKIGPSKVKRSSSAHKYLMKGNEPNNDILVTDNQNKPERFITESSLIDTMNSLEVCQKSEVLKIKTGNQVEAGVIHTVKETEPPSYSDRMKHGENGSNIGEDNILFVGATSINCSPPKEGWPLGISTKGVEVSAENMSLIPLSAKSDSYSSVNGLPPPLPPPLPKSPSESWLWRAMPLVSSPNLPSSPYAGLGSPIRKQHQDLKASIADPKWETIVKSTYTHPDHLRFSEELNRQASPGSFRTSGS
eukprot:Gb_36891 [translate_table: standard]